MEYITFLENNPSDPVVGQAVAGWVTASAGITGCSEGSEAAKSQAA